MLQEVSMIAVLTEFLSACFGFLSALWVDRLISRKRAKSESSQLKTALLATIEKNIDLIQKLTEKMKRSDFRPLYPLDLTILDATAVRKYELLNSVEVCVSIDNTRYDLIRLNDKLSLLRKLFPYKATSNYAGNQYQELCDSCLIDLPLVKEQIETASLIVKKASGAQ
jgi:hypothetical protein